MLMFELLYQSFDFESVTAYVKLYAIHAMISSGYNVRMQSISVVVYLHVQLTFS